MIARLAASARQGPSALVIGLSIFVLCLVWGSTWLVIREGLADVTPQQAAVLMVLFQARRPLTARELAEHQGVSQPTVGRFIKALEQQGWVTRDADPNDEPRDPIFYRLDFRVEKKWRFARTGWVSLVIEMVNATLNREVVGGAALSPVSIPSIGVEGGF